VGRAYVVARPGASLDAAALTAHARQLLAAYKVPKQVVLVAELPRLGSGKIDRRALATLGTLDATPPAPRSATPAEVA